MQENFLTTLNGSCSVFIIYYFSSPSSAAAVYFVVHQFSLTSFSRRSVESIPSATVLNLFRSTLSNKNPAKENRVPAMSLWLLQSFHFSIVPTAHPQYQFVFSMRCKKLPSIGLIGFASDVSTISMLFYSISLEYCFLLHSSTPLVYCFISTPLISFLVDTFATNAGFNISNRIVVFVHCDKML